MRRRHSPPLAQCQAPVRERLPARKASPDRAQGHLAAGLAVNKAPHLAAEASARGARQPGHCRQPATRTPTRSRPWPTGPTQGGLT